MTALVTCACEARQSAYGNPGRRLGTPAAMRAREGTHPMCLGHIDADDNQIILCHHPLPSLLGAGSKPLQLFGLRKTPELSLALRQALSPLGRSGLSSSTGGCRSTARSHILPKFLDTRGEQRD